jgi:hypothetical protein
VSRWRWESNLRLLWVTCVDRWTAHPVPELLSAQPGGLQANYRGVLHDSHSRARIVWKQGPQNERDAADSVYHVSTIRRHAWSGEVHNAPFQFPCLTVLLEADASSTVIRLITVRDLIHKWFFLVFCQMFIPHKSLSNINGTTSWNTCFLLSKIYLYYELYLGKRDKASLSFSYKSII